MNVRTRQEYIDSLRRMRPNVWKFGKLIEDVTAHPATRRTVEAHARAFDAAQQPDFRDVLTMTSALSGRRVYRFNTLMRTPADIAANSKLKRWMYRLVGTCTGALCAGWCAMNALWAVTHEMDADLGTGYNERLKRWILKAEEEGWAAAGALTDAKGDRSKRPSEQSDPDMNLRVVSTREDGVVVRGCKAMICGVAAANEVFVLPGGAYRDEDEAYCVGFVVPRDSDGLTVVETRRPSDGRELEAGFDVPATGITQAYLMFDDVFVPTERLFMCGEHRYTSRLIRYFTSNYRACIGACVAGQGDVLVGAAILMARANGLSRRVFADKLVQMVINNEATYGLGVGASFLGEQHPSGVWIADSLLANANKCLVATLPYETKRLCQEVGGGMVETGCFPAYADFVADGCGEMVRKYLKGAVSAETRARCARLAEWLTIGAGVPGCMHGGGSPDAARLMVRTLAPFEEYAGLAKKIAGITEEVPEPSV